MIIQHHQLSVHKFEQIKEIVKDTGAQHAAVLGVAKTRAQLSN